MRVLTLFLSLCASQVLASTSPAIADCGKGSLFALNPSHTYAAMKTFEKDRRILVWNIASGKAVELSDSQIYVQELFFIDDNHLLAVGSKNDYGPLYKLWDIKSGSISSFSNRTFGDFTDAKTNISQNKRYAVTSSQLAFGGWGYMVIDLKTGKDIYTVQLSKGQGQVSDDGKTLYYTSNYEKECSDGHCAPIQWVKMNTVDIATNKKLFSIPLNTMASDYNRLGWAGDSLVLYDDTAIVFDTKTNRINNPLYRGPLLAWADDFSVMVSGDRTVLGSVYFKIFGSNPWRLMEIRSPASLSVVQLSSDNKKVATLSYSAETSFYDTLTGVKTVMPKCHE